MTIAVTDSTFQAEILDVKQKLVLVDFWAEWCGPCKTIAPIIEKIATDMNDTVKVCKVDVDSNREMAATYQVRGIPTLILFKDSEVLETKVGAVSEEEIVEMINQFV